MHSIAAENVWQHASAAICRAWQAPTLQSIVRFGALEDSLALLHPMLSLHEVKVRVVQVIEETADTKTFFLKPNLQWRAAGVRAGQFVRVRVEINGRRLERNYSLTSIPGQRLLAITVKRQGQVSAFLHQHVKQGSIVTLSQALGEFVLPDEAALPSKILLLSAGSGITPVMAMLRQLQAWRYRGEIVFLHCCKSAEDWIFASELQTIAAQMLWRCSCQI
ncbi:MAG: hypothetical protein HYZ45_09700 [Burkholderiales bacterium]|nr:hypothetical protein [Burkholderiales bacterium]